MEFPGFDPNTKLAAVYYNGGIPPHLFRIRNDVTLYGLKYERIKSTVNSTKKTRGGWSVLNTDVHCPTQPDLFTSAGRNSQTTT